MKIKVLKNVFQRNDNAARENRELLDARGVTCVNLLGGAGAGKTSLLEAVIPVLRDSLRMGVLEGDLATTKDATRVDALGVPVIQLLTDGGCHLTATLVQQGLRRLPLDGLDMLLIENVGNPICPAGFDLGEHLRISVLSVTEGDDKAAKYPLLFKDADLIVLSKCDLQPLTDFDFNTVTRDLRRINRRAEILQTQARRAIGTEALATWLLDRCRPSSAASRE
ncbi:MAG: hydrogenase nickel incorporation protein HypB [Phycisphaerales bacterium]|nr:MAG: hydrogenase nickel incorporation protein HypB [Phycisphaerales bacterium]